MFFNNRNDGHMVEVLAVSDLVNPAAPRVIGRYHYGEEVQDPEYFQKADLVFLSGEPLPRCWTDIHYRDADIVR